MVVQERSLLKVSQKYVLRHACRKISVAGNAQMLSAIKYLYRVVEKHTGVLKSGVRDKKYCAVEHRAIVNITGGFLCCWVDTELNGASCDVAGGVQSRLWTGREVELFGRFIRHETDNEDSG